MSVTILIIDDHPLFREALQSAVHVAYPEAEILEATTIAAGRDLIDRRRDVTLMLLDLSLPGVQGFEGLLELRTHYPRVPVLIVSAFEEPKIIQEAMVYGAAGFIPKSVRKPELAEAIRQVMRGLTYLPQGFEPPERQATGRLGQADLADRLALLTPQQLRVLQMLRQGKLNKQIAHELDVGETTVKAHVSEILRKLGVASRTQAVIEASKLDFDQIRSGEKPTTRL